MFSVSMLKEYPNRKASPNNMEVKMSDKTLICSDCGAEFVFTQGEQDFYAEKGFTNEPKRCPECRKLKKQQRRSFNSEY